MKGGDNFEGFEVPKNDSEWLIANVRANHKTVTEIKIGRR
jgi:hypothetical protein